MNTAFFRGSATGGGTTIETNQRLHLAQMSWDNNIAEMAAAAAAAAKEKEDSEESSSKKKKYS